MNAEQLTNLIHQLLMAIENGETEMTVSDLLVMATEDDCEGLRVRSFEQDGVMSRESGLVVRTPGFDTLHVIVK